MTHPWSCLDCGVDTLPTDYDHDAEYYMVHDDVWEQTGLTKQAGMLCIACLERRIGRCLNPGDFTDCPLNDPAQDDPWHAWAYRSQRLIDRLMQWPLF